LQTLSLRGTFVLNTFDFVSERYSPAAHTTVLQMLPALRTSLSAVRENSWTPLEDLVAYLETTKAMLAPGDPDFYRKMGFYGGRHVRSLPVGIAVSEQMRALRLYGMLWRTFFDAGDLEAIEACPEGAILRIRDFPSAPSFCQRLIGSVDGLLRGAPSFAVIQCHRSGSGYIFSAAFGFSFVFFKLLDVDGST